MQVGDSPLSLVGTYQAIIKTYDKKFEKWHNACKKIIMRYADDRSMGTEKEQRASKFNVLWSNVETLKPALYAKSPKPVVTRRFLQDDPVALKASVAIERCLSYFITEKHFGTSSRQSVLDYLLCGRGVLWVRYVPHMRPIADASNVIDAEVATDGSQITNEQQIGDMAANDDVATAEEVYKEEVLVDYVNYLDFGHNVARTWEEVYLVWRRVWMSKEELKDRFPTKADNIPISEVPEHLKSPEIMVDDMKKAEIYEIWDKSKKKVYWICSNYTEVLDERDDPLGLERFFPCARPLYTTLTNNSLIPTPDYKQYQDQAEELDNLAGRITNIVKAIKVAGVYDAAQQGMQRMFNEGQENQLTPVEAWGGFSEKGGIKGSMELVDTQMYSSTLVQLYQAFDNQKQYLYEISGMGDILRGATNPNETATAQKIKTNFITMRLDERQRDVQRFARNAIEIMGEIICKHFSIEIIAKISGLKLLTEQQKMQIKQQAQMQLMQTGKPPQLPEELQEALQAPSWQDVERLIRDDSMACFAIDVETDSTIQSDQQQEQQSRSQFLQSVSEYLKNAGEMGQQAPEMVPLLGKMLLFAVRAFPVGRELEEVFESTLADMEKMAKNPPPPQPDPSILKAESDTKIAQDKLEMDKQSSQQKQEMDMRKMEAEYQLKIMEMTMDNKLKQQQAQVQTQIDIAVAQQKAELEATIAHIKAAAQIESARIAAKADDGAAAYAKESSEEG